MIGLSGASQSGERGEALVRSRAWRAGQSMGSVRSPARTRFDEPFGGTIVSKDRPVAPLELADVPQWDGEADVVVVGYGVAGACAALGAVIDGADVLVLERAGGWGGAAALSGGFIYLGGGTPLQHACGFEDTPDEMYKFLMAAMGPGADEQKTRLYCDGSVDHYNWLVEMGVDFNAEFFGRPAHAPPADEGLMYSGGENAWPLSEIAMPAPRGHVPRLPPGESRSAGGRGMVHTEPVRDALCY
jgi:3-oxo-5alpha-steroid 4-dehydrogenase